MQAPTDAAAGSTGDAANGEADNLRLLVADESDKRLAKTSAILEALGHEVVARETDVSRVAAALERVKEAQPDLVVTDLMMPVMNGRELIERLRTDAKTAQIPILVITAGANTDIAGADAALRKPFELDALLDAARSLGRKDQAR